MRGAALAAALVVSLAAAVAGADDEDRFTPPQELFDAEALRQAFKDARALFDAGRFAEAATAYGALFERAPWVGLLYNRAVCLELLGEHAAADALYRQALEAASAVPDRTVIQARLDRRGPAELRGVVLVWTRPRMRLRLADGTPIGRTPWNGMLEGTPTLVFVATGLRDAVKPVRLAPRDLTTLYYFSIDEPTHGHLSVSTRPASAHVFVDGEPVGRTPFSDDVALGQHRVVVMKDGFSNVKREIVVTADSPDQELDLALAPAPRAPAPDPPPPSRRTAPWKLVCGGLLIGGTINVGRNIGEDGAPAAVGTAVMGVAAVAFLTWGVVSLL